MHAHKNLKMKNKSLSEILADGANIADNFLEVRIQSIEDFKDQLKHAEAFRMRHKRPFITVSYAQSIDGSIASRNKEQLSLSGPESLALTHQIRASCDSVLVGIGTVLADNPQLTVRMLKGKNPQPIILDTRLRTPLDSKLVRSSDLSTWIINGQRNQTSQKRALQNAGAEPLVCATGNDGKIDLFALMDLLAKMAVNSIMVEGGAQVITSFVNSKLVDQFIITIAPKLVGGLQVFDTHGLNAGKYLDLDQITYQHLGDDMIMWARPKWDTK
jgi:riboflavin-specific deaminase-like protein